MGDFNKPIKRDLVLYDLGFPLSDDIKSYYIFIKDIIDGCEITSNYEKDLYVSVETYIKKYTNDGLYYIRLFDTPEGCVIDVSILLSKFLHKYKKSIDKNNMYISHRIIVPIVEHILKLEDIKTENILW